MLSSNRFYLSLFILFSLCLHFIRMTLSFRLPSCWLIFKRCNGLSSNYGNRSKIDIQILQGLFKLDCFSNPFFLFTLYIFANKVFYIFYMSWASFYFNLPWLNLLTKYEIVWWGSEGRVCYHFLFCLPDMIWLFF